MCGASHVERDEHPRTTVVRELREELGLELDTWRMLALQMQRRPN
jgi:8-oxo-dGTP pyrophosphatase MutT (NUDIX family)